MLLKWILILAAIGLFAILAARAYLAHRAAPLGPWHTHVPDELTAAELARADWTGYLDVESAIFAELETAVTQQLDPADRVPANRYFDGSPLYPGRFAQDWNRSFVLDPDGPPVGAVVLLHGLTDSPYSLRNLARRYREHGYVACAIRLPGHGTVPGGLTAVDWEDWTAATQLAVREARRRAGPNTPLHLVGYSQGGALAMKYALDAIDDPDLPQAERIVLISPMIGITAFARFAGLLGLPAIFPAFANAAWISVLPEFNPFKYNSFPVNAARQSSLLSRLLQRRLARAAQDGRLNALPPILTFQSIVDFTVSTRAIVESLYARLPANGSELVLFDLNRSVKFGPLLRSGGDLDPARLLPAAPRAYRTTLVTNAAADRREVVARVIPAGETAERIDRLGLHYPSTIFSLSHVALPFPLNDPLYGLEPDDAEDFGIRLGALSLRGERGALIVGADMLIRMSSNPFFPYLLDRIEEGIVSPAN
ncbi:alpha/beta hydrolase [uncultured Thiocystis sp.]|uniref:alpha/beta hydrolase n=1 Tax=uncultured Thiocystis sp. TaxID=1202134 RepID=UPI0025DC6DFB|nr:alpha/beta hydrolase [uncultured Thiocystis sp.]